MKKKILAITIMALILSSACSSKDDSKDKKDKDTTTKAEEVKASEDEGAETTEEEKASDSSESEAGETTEASTEDTTESTSEETTTAPTETSERDQSEYVFDISSMTAEEIADLCDSLWTTRTRPQVGDKLVDVQKTYFDIEPWHYLGLNALEARYGKSEKDNVNVIFVCGVNCEGEIEEGGPFVTQVERFGTGLVIDIYDRAKAEEFIEIMKERHPVIEQKPEGSWNSEDFVVGITPTDLFTWDNGVHFQIAYGENSDWYESVSGFFGFGFEINLDETSETTAE